MRYLAFIPASIVALTVIIAAALHLSHGTEIMLASGITGGITIVAAAGLWVLTAANKANTVAVAQIALAALTGQMMLTILSAVIVWGARLTGDFRIFALWLLGFYWVELLVLAPIAIKAIRVAAAHGKEAVVKPL